MAEEAGRGRNRERWSYDLFISFRGADVRNGFVSHLYESLVRAGIYTFKDDQELERGEYISAELLKAIENSRILLVVLSKNYASSPWCLDELLHIMHCRESCDSGQLVLPIFYNVDPSDVRRQRGSSGKYFHRHARRHPESKLNKWKEALTKVANLSGFSTPNYRNDADLINHVTRKILRVLPSSYLHLPAYTVGIRSRLQHIYERMCFGSNDVKVIGICGMGGIGKTTLAKAAYNEYSHRFQGTCFLENFGEYCKGKVRLQQKLLSDILNRHDIVFNNMDHAVKQRFRSKRVLLVIDDVEDIAQLDSVAIDFSCFGPGSRIIITCRNTHLLKQIGVEDIYSPNELDGGESLELVSWHAFRTSESPQEFMHLSEKLVEYCGGLALAIEVLASFLFKRSVSEWESTLELLIQNPNADIQAKLQISFEALSQVEKDVFLDISCFFIGMDKDYVCCILDGCNLHPEIGLTVLKERCLITVRDSKLMMHGLLRDMGRFLVRGTSRNNCERWSRLWDLDNVLEVFANYSGTDATEGLSLKAEVTAVEKLEAKAFSNLRRLRLLQLSHVELSGSYAHFPRSLRWLCWFESPLDSIPTNLHLGSLVVMSLQHSNLKRFWDDQKLKPRCLKKLKYLDLSHSYQLTETPDFSYLPNLEKLFLISCERLVLIHKSIGALHKKLVLLNLKGCNKLGDLPLELYRLKSLETLILSGCSQLERLDDALGELESLTTLKADYTALRQIPSSSNQLKKLKKLSLDGCNELWNDRECIPLSLNGLSFLKTLRLGSCNLSDELIPENLGSLPCLEELDLHGNKFRNLQTDFAGLLSLEMLKLDCCSELQSIFSLPKKLRSLYARNCDMLEKTPDLSECSALQSLHLTNCFNLVDTPGLDKLKTVRAIHMEMCIRISDTHRERIMQGWAVGGNGGVFIPGSSLPSWVSFKSETHSVSFTVPETETLSPDPVGFTLWTRYVSQQDDVMSEYSPKITVKNQSKGDVWSRSPATDDICMFRENHIWQGHFGNEDFCLETGDQVEVSVDFGDEFTILETGLTLAYRQVIVEIPYEELTLTEEEVDDELVIDIEEIQSRHHWKVGMVLKTLLGGFGLLALIVIVERHSGALRRHRHSRLGSFVFTKSTDAEQQKMELRSQIGVGITHRS
uniref:TMV resistance protein N n=2 Tax=Noccaea caerulescens TaxID=107243 RepID=A0A1J3FJB4_NOCCA